MLRNRLRAKNRKDEALRFSSGKFNHLVRVGGRKKMRTFKVFVPFFDFLGIFFRVRLARRVWRLIGGENSREKLYRKNCIDFFASKPAVFFSESSFLGFF